jgi:hypothetical protein
MACTHLSNCTGSIRVAGGRLSTFLNPPQPIASIGKSICRDRQRLRTVVLVGFPAFNLCVEVLMPMYVCWAVMQPEMSINRIR